MEVHKYKVFGSFHFIDDVMNIKRPNVPLVRDNNMSRFVFLVDHRNFMHIH